MAAGLLGEGLAAALQNPWVLAAFALLMAVLSLSMFGVYQLQMPAAMQTATERGFRNAGLRASWPACSSMGALSALIVGPCVAAPLAGALVYISQTRDVLIGGGALFAMAAGMSIPLLLVGAVGRLAAAARRRLDGGGQALLRRADAGRGAVDGVAGAAGTGCRCCGWAALRHRLRRLAAAAATAPAGAAKAGRRAVRCSWARCSWPALATGGRDALAPLAHLTRRAEHTT